MFGSAAVSTPTLPLVFQPPGTKCETKTVLPLSAASADSPAASLQAAEDLGPALNRCRRQPASSHLYKLPAPRRLRAEKFMAPRTSTRGPSLSAQPPAALKLSHPRHHLAMQQRGGRESSLCFDTSCLNFNYLIKD